MQRASIAASVTLAVLAFCPAAAAQSSTTLQARGSFGVTYTDNALAAPSDPAPGDPALQEDVFLLMTPGLTLFHETPRAQLLLSYEHPVALYLLDGSASNASDLVTFNSVIAASPVDTLIVGTRLSRATTRQTTISSPELTNTAIRPTGDNTLVTVNFTEVLAHDFSEDVRGTQTAGSTAVFPIDEDTTQAPRWLISGSLAADYRLGLNSLGLVADHALVYQQASNADNTVTSILVSNLSARWRRDLAVNWTVELSAGVNYTFNTNTFDDYIGPAWSALLGYGEYGYSIDLNYNRSVVPNVVAGPTSLTDALALVGGMPIVEDSNIALTGSIGASYNQILAINSGDAGTSTPSASVISWTSDVALFWSPPRAPAFSIRYQHIEQLEPTQEVEDPTTGTPLQRPFATNQVQFMMTYVFPQANLPALRFGVPRRVDAADTAPLFEAPPGEPNTGTPTSSAPAN